MGILRGTMTIATVLLVAGACSAGEEIQSPTFRVTAPALATTTSTAPERLAWVGNPNLTPPESAMCAFIDDVDARVTSADYQNELATIQAENRAVDRTLAEPLRVRMFRDTEVANAQRIASALGSFAEGSDLLTEITPNERVGADVLAETARDIDEVVAISQTMAETIDRARPLSGSEQADYETRTGSVWEDIFTEIELEPILEDLHNEVTGMGLEDEARDLMGQIDDWSWRQCSEGFSD